MADEICFNWSQGNDFLVKDFHLVVLIPLRTLQESTLKEKLLDVIGKDVYDELVKSLGSRCLIILERLDEVSLKWQKNDKLFVQMIKEKSVFEEAKILITSRPHALVALYSASNIQKDARRVEIVGFSKQQIREYVEMYCTNPEMSKSFMDQLEKFPNIASMCYVPLCLKMIVQSFKHSNEILPDPCILTEIYHSFVVCKLQNRGGNINLATLNDDDEHYIKNLLCVFGEAPAKSLRTIYLLSKLSYNAYFKWCSTDEERKSPRVIFSQKELSQCNIKISSESDAHGLLKATHVLHGQVFTTSNDIVYNFNHLSIQEYLCALYISLLPEDKQVHLFEDYLSNFPHMWPFYFGITRCKLPKILRSLLEIVLSINHKDKISALHCIYEAQVPPEQCTHVAQASLTIKNLPMLPYDCLTISYFMSIVPVLRLNLEKCHINDQLVPFLFRYKSLAPQKAMMFDRNSISNEGMQLIASLTFNRVTHLSFSGNFWYDTAIHMSLSTQTHFARLVELDVSNCYMDSNMLGNFLAVNASLLSLNISYAHFINVGIAPISHALQHNHTLVQLIAMGCKISYDGALSIRNMLEDNNSLKLLNLDDNPFGVNGIMAITEALPSNSMLSRLDINSSRTEEKIVCKPKKRTLGNSVLKMMFLGNNNFCDFEIKCILPKSLTHLILAAIDGCNSLKHALCLPQLRELVISSCSFVDADNIIALGNCLEINTVLQSLSIMFIPISDEEIIALTNSLQANNSLLHLALSSCHLSNKAGKCINEMLTVNKGLQSLKVSDHRPGCDFIIAIADSLYINKTLAKLDVEYCKNNDAGVLALAKVLQTTKTLKELNIEGTKSYQIKTLIEAAHVNPVIQSIIVSDDQLDPTIKVMLNSVNNRNPKVCISIIHLYCHIRSI